MECHSSEQDARLAARSERLRATGPIWWLSSSGALGFYHYHERWRVCAGGEESTRRERACSLSSEGVSLHGHSSDDYEPPGCFFRHTTTKWSGPSGRGVARRGYNAYKVTRLQLRRVGGSATIEEVNRDDTDDGLAPRLRSH